MDRHIFQRDLHAHIAPGYHDTVRNPQDLVDVFHALGILDLGDDLDAASAMLLQEPARLTHIFGSAHKGRCHKIKTGFNAEEQILLVRFTEEGQGQMHTRHIDTLAVGNPAAALDCGVDLPLVGDIIHRQFDQTVVDQHPAARTQIPAQSAIGDVGAFLCTRHLFRCQDKVRTGLQHNRTVFKYTQPDLRALGVQHGADGEAEFLPQAIHNPELFQMFLMGAMGEIEPGHIHTRFHHTPESCLIQFR